MSWVPTSYAELAPYLERWPARAEYRRRFPEDHPPTQGFYPVGQAPYYETYTKHMVPSNNTHPIREPTRYISGHKAAYSYRRVAPEELFWPKPNHYHHYTSK